MAGAFSGLTFLRLGNPLRVSVMSGSGLPKWPGPALIKPSSNFVILDAPSPLGVASPNLQPDDSILLVRADDLLVMQVSQYRNANNQVFLGFDFPSQHAAEATNPESVFSPYTPPPVGQPSPAGDSRYQSAPSPASAGPFGWSGDDATTGGVLLTNDLMSNRPLPAPSDPPIVETTLWWNDLRLPCTSVLLYLPGMVAGSFAQGQAPIDRGVEFLLDWSTWSLCITPGAASTTLLAAPGTNAPPPQDPANAPGSRLTMMFGMVFAPTEQGAWTHVNLPIFGSTGSNELWHTRLVPRTSGGQPTLRATYSLAQAIGSARATELNGYLFPNTPVATNPSPQLYDGVTEPASLTEAFALVYPGDTWVTQPPSPLTGPPSTNGETAMGDLINYTTYNQAGTTGMELPAEGVLLSATGGSLRFAADFTGDPRQVTPGALLYLSHQQHLGRDVAASSARTASLVPFGQPVIFGSTFRRTVFSGSSFALLNEQDSVHLINRAAQMPGVKDFVQPFQSLSIVNQTFPLLYHDPATGFCYPLNALGQPALNLNGEPTNQPIIAHYEAIDAAGATIAFQLPLQLTLAGGSGSSQPVTLAILQQKVAYSTATNSTFATVSLQVSTAGGGFEVMQAVVHHPAITQFTGAEPESITLQPPAQPGGDALAMIQSPPSLDGTQHTDKYGAFAAPAIPKLSVLSKLLGAAGASAPPAPADAQSEDVDTLISNLFGETLLLGVFPLAGLINDLAGKAPTTPLPAPKVTSTNQAGVLTVSMDVQAGAADGSALSVNISSLATLSLQSVTFNSTTTHGPSGTTTQASCTIESPTIQIPAGAAQLVSFDFNSMNFTASSAAKPTVTVDFNAIEFHGNLSFVNTIIAILPSSLFSNPPEVTITDSQCEIACGVGFPSLGIGVFSLSNINLAANLTIPFVADPASTSQITFGFDFSTLDDPFTLSVMGFAGSGSFGVAISPNAISVDGSLAFGGDYDVSVIVAEGWVSLEAGVHITYTSSPTNPSATDVDVGGFVHLSGGIEVLELVSLTLDAMLALNYDSAGNSFSGTAEITLGVDLTFYHTSVSFSVSETFSGAAPAANTDMELAIGKTGNPHAANPFIPAPDFLAAVRQNDWSSYCNAFAA